MEVTFQGVLDARRRIAGFLRPTPLVHHPLLSRRLGCELFVKHENCNPTGSFKIRGGINLIGRLSEGERKRGVVTATRGNHGQSIALACRIFGVPCVIAVPHGNNPEKNEAMEAYGAELIVHGRDFDEARLRVEELQQERDLRYVHSANEAHLIHGVGTYALEILEDLPDPDCILVPVGGGSGISGVLTVFGAAAPGVRVIGVQAENAPAVTRSWREGKRVETDSAETIADGLATRVTFDLPFGILSRMVDDMTTVSETDLAAAVYEYFRYAHTVAEPAAAAPLAAVRQLRDQLAGKKVVLVLTGANISTGLFREILSGGGRGQEGGVRGQESGGRT